MAASALDVYGDVERRLKEWGDACRSTSEQLGLPRSSGIARMIEVVKVFETRRRGTRKRRKTRDGVTTIEPKSVARCEGCGLIRGPGECPRCGSKVTARGTETRSLKPLQMVELSGTVASMDAVVAALPGWMQKVIMRSYLWGQPDRLAAQEMRMPRTLYRTQREAALEFVAERLALRRAN